jgi:hypothetical protein
MERIKPDIMMIWARIWRAIRISANRAFGEQFHSSPELILGMSKCILHNETETLFITAGNRLGHSGFVFFLVVEFNDEKVLVEVVEFEQSRRVKPDPDFLAFALPLIDRAAALVRMRST